MIPTKKVPASELEDKPSPRRSPDPDRNTPDEKDAEKPKAEGEDDGKPTEEIKKEDELVDIEEDQNDVALAVANHVKLAPGYSVFIMNQYA